MIYIKKRENDLYRVCSLAEKSKFEMIGHYLLKPFEKYLRDLKILISVTHFYNRRNRPISPMILFLRSLFPIYTFHLPCYNQNIQSLSGGVNLNGAILLIPFFIIRFGLMRALNKNTLRRAAHFAPLMGGEKAAYCIYQLCNTAVILYPFFLKIAVDMSLISIFGLVVYCLGLILLTASVISFSHPCETGLNKSGVYSFSRNPMYLAYFVIFVSMSLLMRSLLLFGITVVFQISAHWIILSEERWCLEKFGTEYGEYMKKVSRYI